MGYWLPRTTQGAGDATKTVAKGAQMHCLTAAQSIALKYCELQHCAPLRSERRTRQFRWFVVGQRNCCDLLKNVDGSWRI